MFLVIGKLPKKGFAKTRLATGVGEQEAQNLYSAFISDFLRGYSGYQGREKLGPLELLITPSTDEARGFFNEKLKLAGITSYKISFQDELPFFERIYKGLESFTQGDFIHLTGTDLPDFPFSFLDSINEKVQEKPQDKSQDKPQGEVWIGPDLDGGFYYLGFPVTHKNIFHKLNVSDGETTVFEAICKRCKELGLKINTLPKWSDIDDIGDLKRAVTRSSEKLDSTLRVFNSLKLKKS